MARRIQSAQKRARQSIKRNRRNRAIKSQIRAALKDVQTNTDESRKKQVTVEAQSVLDRAAGKGVLSKNKVARLKSQFMRKKATAPKTKSPS